MGPRNPVEIDLRRGLRISLIAAFALLTIGGILGFALRLPATQRADVDEPTTTVANEVGWLDVAGYRWTSQDRSGSAGQAWGLFAADEIGDTLYLLVFADVRTPESRAIWRSEDGSVWDEIALDLGDETVVHDLRVYEGSLLLAGWHQDVPTIWASRGHVGPEDEWIEIPLPYGGLPGGAIRAAESDLDIGVNAAGEIVVSVATHFELTPLLLELAGDPTATSLLHLAELPQVAVSQQRLWAHVTTMAGTETTQFVDLPGTAVFDPDSGSYGTGTGLAIARSLWVSKDGRSFTPVDMTGTPVGPQPHGLADSFFTAIPRSDGSQTLWRSPDGVSWDPANPPPSACSSWTTLAVGAPGLLLTNDRFDLMCVSSNGLDWTVKPSPATAVSTSGQAWVEGGDTGFVALVNSTREFAVLVSSDGFGWEAIDFGPGTAGSHTLQVGDRLVASVMVIEQDPPGRRFELRVGTPISP